MKQSILIFNGSPQGARSNCTRLISIIATSFSKSQTVKVIHLSKIKNISSLYKEINKASGFIFVTGTYWDSWGSPLQRFLEEATELEGTDSFTGKPAAVFVLNHSVGGKGVLSRLQGVLSTFGCLIPPMSGMVYSLVTALALKSPKAKKYRDDFWSLDDITLILENFKLALSIKTQWKTWPVDRKNFRDQWL